MPASSLYFDGRLTYKPGAYTKIDASALDAAGFGASGIVALVGESIGGIPWNAITDPANELQSAVSTGQARDIFRSGDLLELTAPLLNPSPDDAIPGGAQRVIFVKVNPATQSAVTFGNTDGDAVDFTSVDYGLHTTQISVEISDATAGAPAKKVDIIFEDSTETFDNLGVNAKFTLQYDGGSDGATRATADAGASAFEIDFERDDLGQDNLVTTQATGGASLEIVSDNAGDTTQQVTVYGLDATDQPQIVTATLSGTTPVALSGTWNLQTAVVLDSAAAGTVTVRNVAGAVVVFDVPAATLSEGRVALDIPVADGATPGLTIVSDGASTQRLVVRGISQTNQPIAEVITLTGTTPVSFVGLWSSITSLELADVEVAQTLTMAGRMVNAPHASYDTLQKLKDLVNANSDFTLTMVATNPTEVLVSDLDISTGVDVMSPATGSFFARLYDMITAINSASALVTAARATPGTGAPDNGGPTFLTGGHEGDATPGNEGVPTSTSTDWQGAIDLLKRIRVNTLVLATTDAATHALGEAHCAYMGGAGRSERDCVVGAAANETLAALKTRAQDLNSRHTRLCTQEVLRFNSAGERTWQSPVFQAAIIAGMQSGSPVGTPLTNKVANVLGVRQNTGWNPVDDADEAISSGLLFMETIDGVGTQVVRNVTTHLSSSILAFTEASANEALNFAVFEYRKRMNAAAGRKGTLKTVTSMKGIAIQVLKDLVAEEILVAFSDPVFTLELDKLKNEVGMAVVLPINFVPITVFLETVTITA